MYIFLLTLGMDAYNKQFQESEEEESIISVCLDVFSNWWAV